MLGLARETSDGLLRLSKTGRDQNRAFLPELRLPSLSVADRHPPVRLVPVFMCSQGFSAGIWVQTNWRCFLK